MRKQKLLELKSSAEKSVQKVDDLKHLDEQLTAYDKEVHL